MASSKIKGENKVSKKVWYLGWALSNNGKENLTVRDEE